MRSKYIPVDIGTLSHPLDTSKPSSIENIKDGSEEAQRSPI